jgi:hypothetical protein
MIVSNAITYPRSLLRLGPVPIKPMLTITVHFRVGEQRISPMPRLIARLETVTVYAVIASALAGTALNALVQFYPIN